MDHRRPIHPLAGRARRLPRPAGARQAGSRGVALLVVVAHVAALSPAAGFAHEFWLSAARPGVAAVDGRGVTAGDTVLVRAWVGTGFRGEPKSYAVRRALRLEMVARQSVDLRPAALNGDLVFARFVAPDAGGVLVAYESDFAFIEMTADQFERYLIEEGQDAALAARRRAGARGPARERYARCCKTWIAGGDVARARHVVGMPLEIVPLDDPTAGGTCGFRVLHAGAPLAGALVRTWNQPDVGPRGPAQRDSVPPVVAARSDADGTVRFDIATAGEWLVGTVHMLPSTAPAADWESRWASFTFTRPAQRGGGERRAPRRRRRERPLRRPRRRRARPAAALALALVLAPHVARPHAEPFSWVELHLDPAPPHGQVTAHIEDLAYGAGIAARESLLVPEFVQRHRAAIDAALAERLRLQFDGTGVQPQWTRASVVADRRSVRVEFELDAPIPRQVRLEGPLFSHDPAHETYFNVYTASGLVHQDLLDRQFRSSTFGTGPPQNHAAVVRRFVREGVHHIFIGPDHILFVIGLLLMGGGLGRLLRIVTAFTIAHSLTLALAATGIVAPPPRLVESVIALSIMWVGADNLLGAARGGPRRRDRRIWIAAAFGLVHGFGFASVLREVGLPPDALAWSLLAFNLGVEIGQACIVLAVAPLLGLLHARRPAWAARAVAAGSGAVIAAGTFWFVQRAFLA